MRFLTTLPDKVTKNYGERVLAAIKALFKVYHRREKMSASRFLRRMDMAKQLLIKKVLGAPARTEARNLAKRFKDHADSYFRFITMPGVSPTNNAAYAACGIGGEVRARAHGKRGIPRATGHPVAP